MCMCFCCDNQNEVSAIVLFCLYWTNNYSPLEVCRSKTPTRNQRTPVLLMRQYKGRWYLWRWPNLLLLWHKRCTFQMLSHQWPSPQQGPASLRISRFIVACKQRQYTFWSKKNISLSSDYLGNQDKKLSDPRTIILSPQTI